MAKKKPEWKDSKYADAEGKFKELSCGDLANWLIKSSSLFIFKFTNSKP